MGLIHDTEIDQRVVDQAVSSEQRDPGDHADHVRGPKRDGAKKKKRDLPGQRLDVEGQEIGDGKAEDQGDQPDNETKLHRLPIGLPGDVGGEDVAVILGGEVGNQDLVGLVVEEGDDHHQDHRHNEKRQKD